MFTIEMLPAEHGDCLWIEYGSHDDPRRVLIDGGPVNDEVYAALRKRLDERLGHLPADDRVVDLLVVTHIDADHIGGVLTLLHDDGHGVRFGDVWFNGWDHLPSDELGAKQGEQLTEAIRSQRLPWNDAFSGGAAVVPDAGPPAAVDLPGGLRLTLLSPTTQELRRLKPKWEEEVRKAGMVPGVPPAEEPAQPDVLGEERLDPEELAAERFVSDGSVANGASIALLAEYEGRSCLLAGDAHAEVLANGLTRLATERGVARVAVDAFKLPHHGSRRNVSTELLSLLDCPRYLFSTSGKIFHHPDAAAVSRVLVGGGDGLELAFNYRSQDSARWDDARLKRRFGYETVYPSEGELGLTVAL